MNTRNIISLITALCTSQIINTIELEIENKFPNASIIVVADGEEYLIPQSDSKILTNLPKNIKVRKSGSLLWHTTGLEEKLDDINYDIHQNKNRAPRKAFLTIAPGKTAFSFNYGHLVEYQQQSGGQNSQARQWKADEIAMTQNLLDQKMDATTYTVSFSRMLFGENPNTMKQMTNDPSRKAALLERVQAVRERKNQFHSPESALDYIFNEEASIYTFD